MLAKMMIGGQVHLAAARLSAPADYMVTSDAEWNAVFANDAATLSGKVVEVVGSDFTQRTIENLDIAAEPLTIRGKDGAAALPSLLFNGTVRGVDVSALALQMTGWPADHGSCVIFNNGTFDRIRFLNGTTFRHGYGANQADIDTAAELPEYERIDNVQTATTASATHALTWKDPDFSSPVAWIYVFNRGSETVHVAVGGSGVTASTGDAAVAPGASLRVTGLDPTTDTHFAVIAAAGTCEVNARTEIGLHRYMANAFASSGAANTGDIEIRNCIFRDLSNGVKGLLPDNLIVMDNDFDRIYQDIYSFAPKDGGSAYVLRNLENLPFSRSGIAENLEGDAGDPHGDQLQLFGNGTYTIRNVYYAGNRPRLTARRTGAKAQGIWISDNDINPAFENLFIISAIQPGGSPRAISIEPGEGTSDSPRDLFIYGATVFDGVDLASDTPAIDVDHDGSGAVYLAKSIGTRIEATNAPLGQDDNLILATAASRPAVFPNLADYPSATNRTQIEAALATAAEGEGLGAAATASVIDWTTSDHTAVIQWADLPSGVEWNDLTGQAASSVITLPLRKVLNRRGSQTVTVGAGTEWRSVDTDGTTEIQAWTTSAGTIEPDQFIQVRRTSGAGGSSVTASVTINGFEQAVDIRAANVPTSWLVQGATTGYFLDPDFPPAASKQEFRGKFYFPAGTLANNQRFFTQEGGGAGLFTVSNGVRMTAEDGTGTNVGAGATIFLDGSVIEETWLDIAFIVDHTNKEFRLTINEASATVPFTTAGNGTIQTNREHIFLAADGGGNPLPATVRAADLELYLDGVLRKAISNTATAANADAWHQGGDLIDT